MAMSMLPAILKERKLPFIIAFFLLILVTFLLLSDTRPPFPMATNFGFPIRSDEDVSSPPDSINLTTQSDTTTEMIVTIPSDSNDTTVSTNSSVVDRGTESTTPSDPDAGTVLDPTSLPKSDLLSSSNAVIPPNHALSSDNDIASNNESSAADTSDHGNVVVAAPESSAVTVNDSAVVDVKWKLCLGPVAVDYIPCLDNWQTIMNLKSRRHKEHRERHCPNPSPRCLVPLPNGYKIPVQWPKSRDMIWYSNVPHPKLVEYKKDQRWVLKNGEYFNFPGGGTQFTNGVDVYISSVEKALPMIEWGRKTRVVLDVGCGVASFGGALLDRNVITMSMAPKDEHDAQIQFALERGIPATLAVIGSQKLTFPDNSFDLIHCARCRVNWDADGGKPLMELNRLLRPGGYFIWSATPVYQKDEKHRRIWKSMVALTESLCWSMVAKTFFPASHVGLAIYQKPESSYCYLNRKVNKPPLCDKQSRFNSSWYSPLDSCIVSPPDNSYLWPSPWPERLADKPPQLPTGSDAEETFKQDTKHWSALVSEVYLGALAINWTSLRNVMDMNAGYGGFAAAVIDQPLWVMNVVPIHEPDTLPVIYDRGLIGMYHDWCESFSTYPRAYDLLHASFLLGKLTKRCDIVEIAAEMDRILRPDGYLLVQDSIEVITMLNPVLKSLHWSTKIHRNNFLVSRKGFWRPDSTA